MTFTLSPDDIIRCREISLGNRDLIMDIVRSVSEQTGIPVSYIQGASKTRKITEARWLICYIAHVDSGFGLEAIGRVLRKDHSSVLHGVKRERERRKEISKAASTE
jgi:chromosomal replication initiation ATPase DnaA